MPSASHSPSGETIGTPNEFEMFRAGDPAFIKKLYTKCDGRLHVHAKCLLGDADDADDAVAETWRLAWDRRTQIRGGDSVPQWLLGICDAVCVNKILQQQREDRVLHDVALSRSASGIEVSVEASAAQVHAAVNHLTAALKTLPRRQSEAVTFRYLMNKTTAETAQAMRCSAATVRANLHKALERLDNTSAASLALLLAARASLVSTEENSILKIPIVRDDNVQSDRVNS